MTKTDYCDGAGKCVKGFAATPPDAPVTDNQQRAAEVVRSMNPEHAYVDEFVYDGDAEPLVRAVAAALNAAEVRGRAEVVALIQALADCIDGPGAVSAPWLRKRLRDLAAEVTR